MLDLLEHYIYDSLPREDFATSPGLRRKVGPEGELLPFYGCTAVFWLPEAAREAVAGLQARLYSAAGGPRAPPPAARGPPAPPTHPPAPPHQRQGPEGVKPAVLTVRPAP